MTNKSSKPHLRLIVGGKADEPKSRKVMTEIGLLDKKDLEAWNLVRQVPPPSNDDFLAEAEREANIVQGLLAERLHKLYETYPQAEIDPKDMRKLPPEMQEIMFAPPLFLTEDGLIVLLDY